MHSLLLGNGINRVALQKDWLLILKELAQKFGADDLIQHLEGKPLSMFIEELSARSSGRFLDAENRVKRAFAKLLKQIDPIEAHRRICEPFRVIMTTNYDFTIEEALVGPLHSPAFLSPESRYSLFRRYKAGSKEVWHVHGDVARPSSMVLGFDQYAGSLQKIRNYVMTGIDVSTLPYRLSSAVKSGHLRLARTRAEQKKRDQAAQLDAAKGNGWGLHLEFRIREGAAGWGFHDRFIIFPREIGSALAWSLGTSINSYGDEHHILQKVAHGEPIAQAFQDLWEQLEGEQYLIWKTP